MKKLNSYNNYHRTINYKYLDEDGIKLIKNLILKFIDDTKLYNNISNLKYDDFEEFNFYYFNIYFELFTSNQNNIYRYIQTYLRTNDINLSTPPLNNTIFDIIENIYNTNKKHFNSIFDDKLISIFDNNHNLYLKKYKKINNFLNKKIKDSCEYILTTNQFNL